MTPDPTDQSTPPSGYHIPAVPIQPRPRRSWLMVSTLFYLINTGGSIASVSITQGWNPPVVTALAIGMVFPTLVVAIASTLSLTRTTRIVLYGGIALAAYLTAFLAWG